MLELLAVIAFSAMWLLLGAWAAFAQRDYLRLRAERLGPKNPLVDSDELLRRYLERPWRWFAEAPGLLRDSIRSTGEHHKDPVLEAARLHYVYRRRMMFVLGLIGFAFLIVLLTKPF
jgi:hypothetical protein